MLESSGLNAFINRDPGSCVFLFLPDVLGTASADTRCARPLRPFCFALLFFPIVELRAETIRTLDRSTVNAQHGEAAEPRLDEVPR